MYSFHQATAETLPAIADLIRAVEGDAAAALTETLALQGPGMGPADVLWLRHDPTGEPVSTLTLIPWTWRIGACSFPVLETGIVVTAEAHRGRGLCSRLMAEAEALRRARNLPVSVIQGIPRFYRQFGYEYALPLEPHEELELRQVPDLPEGWSWRAAGPGDLPLLTRWETEAQAGFGVAAVRDPGTWAYRLGRTAGTETETHFRVILGPGGRPEGYAAWSVRGFGEGLIVAEAGGGPGLWPAAAALLAAEARRQGKPYLRLNLGSAHPFVGWARTRGSVNRGGWHWQIRFDDPQAALGLLAPAWESRWPENGPGTLVLDFYQGRTAELRAPGPGRPGRAEVRMPPEILPKVVFGWKEPAELRAFYPDYQGEPEDLALLDRLFPRLEGFCASPY